MKLLLSILLTLIFSSLYAQDTSKVKEINTMVARINNSKLPEKKDTIRNNYSKYGLSMTTYLTLVANDSEIIKYANFVNTTTTQGGITKKSIFLSTLYYDHNELIKAEAYSVDDNVKKSADFYYWDDKFIYTHYPTDDAKERAAMLLNLSKTLMKQLLKKP